MSQSIFFIDDDEALLYVVTRVCKTIEGVSAYGTAKNGKDALDQIESWIKTNAPLPSLMFVDINMPVMNGFEFLENFKVMKEKYPQLNSITPVIILTSSQQESDRKKAFSTGVVDKYLVKGDDVKAIEAMIRDQIQ